MANLTKKLKSLPSSPGVYIFYAKGTSASGGKDKSGEVIYVGKAGSLKDRVNSYFQSKNGYARPIEIFISEVKDFEIRRTDTVLEAYILEQELIKKMQPKYNVDGKDDKSFSYVLVTKEEFPKFIIMRATDIAQISNFQFPISNYKISKKIPYTKIYGPYTSKHQIETALKILRKIFPYHNRKEKTEKGCLDYQIGLCPGPYDGAITKKDYAKNVKAIRMILEGKKKSLINKMKKEMEEYSKGHEFEKAAGVRNKIFALQHVQDIALIAEGDKNFQSNFNGHSLKFRKIRIEGYDISNISGKYTVGSMVVFDNLEGDIKPNKSQYRKFRIKTIEGANDVGAMEEVLSRRFKNNWPKPGLIILDGGKGHLNIVRKILRNYRLEIPLIAVAKGPTRKKLDVYSFGTVPEISKDVLEQVRNEAHRFAIKYHRNVRKKSSLI